MFMDQRPMFITNSDGSAYQVQWGFFLENTLFRAFEPHNNRIIEQAHQELAHRVGNNYVDIMDQVLGSEARVYFGVERIHLRMPGTRYYVERRLTVVNTNSGSSRGRRWPTTTRRSTVRHHRSSTPAPVTLTAQPSRRSNSRRSRASSSAVNVVKATTSKMSAMPTPSASTKTSKSTASNRRSSVYAANDFLQIIPSTSAPTLGYVSTSTFAQIASINGPESFDWEIIPPLVHKVSQEWSQASSSSSTTLPLSPSLSPDWKRKKHEATINSGTTYPTPKLMEAQCYMRQRQQQETAFLSSSSVDYYQQVTSPSLISVPVASSSSCTPQEALVTTCNSLPIDEVDYHVADALNAMSISFPSQGLPQQTSQDIFLMTPPMKESSMTLDQLPTSDLSGYWVWPSMTANIHPTLAAVTADLRTENNGLQLFDDKSQMTWYTNNVTESMGFSYQQ